MENEKNAGNTGSGAAAGNQQQQGQRVAPVVPPAAAPPVATDPRQTLNTEQKGLNPRDTLNTSQHNNQSEARRALNIIQKGGKGGK
ncbi:MAG TPA: hypothetical protein VNE63_11170 [Candidatus Acidoferrales bacterium]|nr:hypothetical protein [Candidatus Acidoferrales bacterium]